CRPVFCLDLICLRKGCCPSIFSFLFKETTTTEIYTLSLHDALPIWTVHTKGGEMKPSEAVKEFHEAFEVERGDTEENRKLQETRSEEHTSELQSRENLVCRLLLEKKKKRTSTRRHSRHANIANTD